jgi:hypothetical protein
VRHVAHRGIKGTKMAEQDAPQPPANRESKSNGSRAVNLPDVVAEADNRHCHNVVWGPTQTVLRGSWVWDRLPRGTTSERGLVHMPNLPGMCVAISPRERQARIYDPLGLPENERLLEKAQGVARAVFGESKRPAPTVTYRNLTDGQLATWLFHLLRHAQAERMRVIKGSLSDLEAIARALPQAVIHKDFFSAVKGKESQVRAKEAQDQVADASEDVLQRV